MPSTIPIFSAIKQFKFSNLLSHPGKLNKADNLSGTSGMCVPSVMFFRYFISSRYSAPRMNNVFCWFAHFLFFKRLCLIFVNYFHHIKGFCSLANTLGFHLPNGQNRIPADLISTSCFTISGYVSKRQAQYVTILGFLFRFCSAILLYLLKSYRQ